MPEVTADDHTLGSAGAPVTVLEYGDYECPFCRGAYRDVHRMLDENRHLVMALRDELLTREELVGDEIIDVLHEAENRQALTQ